MLDDNLNIFYSGGSGGFYLLHWILLYRKHFANFDVTDELKNKFFSQLTKSQKSQIRLSKESYQSIKDSQWPCYDSYYKSLDQFESNVRSELDRYHMQWGDPSTVDTWVDFQIDYIIKHQWRQTNDWKSTEQWPRNSLTQLTQVPQRQYKIYFFCNNIQEWKNYPGKRLVIYTDIFSQIRLCEFKNANWFRNTQFSKKQIIEKILKNETAKISGDYVYKDVASAVNLADYAIKLQDLVADPTGTIGVEPTEFHKKFRDHWRSLHPTKLLKKCKL